GDSGPAPGAEGPATGEEGPAVGTPQPSPQKRRKTGVEKQTPEPDSGAGLHQQGALLALPAPVPQPRGSGTLLKRRKQEATETSAQGAESGPTESLEATG
ncbi:unnamed protein product, partial [Polarella glacialis]